MAKIRFVGVDEVGRGPLAGPVTVCAFAVKPAFNMNTLAGVTDSKKMSKKSREEWSQRLHIARRKGEVDFVVYSMSAREIDARGISKAVYTAVYTALRRLNLNPQRSKIFLDGLLKAPRSYKKQQTIIGGDGTHKLISAASVIAKVHRDAYMSRLGKKYPLYSFERHKGYGTKIHRSALRKHGLSDQHRRSFCKGV